MRRWWFWWTAVVVLVMSTAATAEEVDGEAQVEVLYLSSPQCPFCQVVEERDLAPLQEEYGAALRIEVVDTTTDEGSAVLREAWEHYELADNRRGVPTVIIDNQVLVGAGEIPEQLAGFIEEAKDRDGAALPALASLEQWMQLEGRDEIVEPRRSWVNRFERDMPGNAVSAALLVIMLILGLVMVIKAPWQRRWGRGVPLWTRSTVAVVGLGISAYLTYGETTQEEMLCGPIGQCNIVQQSEMAMVFGVIPLALFGVLAYGALLGLYGMRKWGAERWQRWSPALALGVAAPGFVFSILLTFWQPFILGATCAWCLGSAITMSASCLFALGEGREQWGQWIEAWRGRG